jgi:hypothetical protein
LKIQFPDFIIPQGKYQEKLTLVLLKHERLRLYETPLRFPSRRVLPSPLIRTHTCLGKPRRFPEAQVVSASSAQFHRISSAWKIIASLVFLSPHRSRHAFVWNTKVKELALLY